MLINLVQNSADALGKGGTIKLRAVESQMALGGRMREVVIIEVEDNGTGIPPEVQSGSSIRFSPPNESGTGLGLSIAARIRSRNTPARSASKPP